MTATEPAYEIYEGADAARRLDDFLGVYEEVYAEPPYREGPSDVAQFVERYHAHTRRPGMRLVLARAGGEVVGFGYGYPLPPDTQWWTSVVEELPAGFTQEDGARTLAVIELAVVKPWRRRGVAAALHALLREGLGVERVTLTVRPEPEAMAAQKAYASWGYREVGRSHPWEEAPYYTAMVLDLTRQAS